MLWITFALCFVRIAFVYNPTHFTRTTPSLHLLCLRYIEWRDFPSIYNGLVCGSSHIDSVTQDLFLGTGLYHLVVVSGSHLAFIDLYLEKIKARWFVLKWLVLFTFSYMCLLNAPILRALVQYTSSAINGRLRLSLRRDQMVLITGLMTLTLFPEWIGSLSLQLSWMAALCMSLKISAPKKAFLCLVYMSPLIGTQNPQWAGNNLLFITAFEFFLFPFTALSLLLPWTSTLAHWVWDVTLEIIKHLPSSTPTLEFPARVTSNWIFVFCAQLIHYWIRK